MSDDASRKDRRILGTQARPQHDQPCKRIAYSDPKLLFEMLMKEASDG